MRRPRRARISGRWWRSGPGEYVAIDTTSLDVFAIDPFTFQWVGLDFTAALDVCTRSILAFRLTPFSTQGVDLALLLSDLLSPTPMDGRWPSDVPYPYCGVPESLVLRAFELPAGTALAPRPTVRPGTVVIDRGSQLPVGGVHGARASTCGSTCSPPGRIGVRTRDGSSGCSEQCASGCWNRCRATPGRTCSRAARTSRPTPCISRTNWRRSSAAGSPLDYQRRPHDGLRVPEAPHLRLSPNEAYEEAVGRAGFLYVPRDPELHLRLLPVEARVIGRAGVEIAGLTYDSPALDPYRQQRCPLPAFDGKWPIRVDPRELGRVWFQDPRDERFHELRWRHAREVARPFGGSALCLREAAAG